MFAIITYLANVTMGKNHNHICFNYKKKLMKLQQQSWVSNKLLIWMKLSLVNNPTNPELVHPYQSNTNDRKLNLNFAKASACREYFGYDPTIQDQPYTRDHHQLKIQIKINK